MKQAPRASGRRAEMILAALAATSGIAAAVAFRYEQTQPRPVPPHQQTIAAIYVTSHAGLAVWFAVAVVAALVWFGAPVLAPWVLRASASSDDPAARRSRGPAAAAGALSLAAMAVLAVLGRGEFWPRYHPEAIGFMAVAEVCAHGVRCPLVGPPMLYGIHLGPAFYQVLSLVHLAADPRTAFFVLLQAQVALAVVLLGLAAHEALGGGPWGVVAGASLYFSETFRSQLLSPDHATLAILPGAGFVYAALSYSRHRRGRDFVWMSLCLVPAVQLYGILFPFAVAMVVLGLVGRASWRAWLAASLVWLAGFASWLLFEAKTYAYELTHTFGYEGAFTVTGAVGRFDPEAFDGDLWLLGVLGLLYAASLVARRTTPAAERRAAVGILVLGLTALGTCWLGRARWSVHYSLILHLGLAPAFAAASCALWREAARLFPVGRARRWGVLRLASAAGLLLVVPLARRATRQVDGRLLERGVSPPGYVSYTEQDQLGSLLSARGFGRAELERNVHGVLWDLQPGPGWFYDPGAARGTTRDPARHALVVTRCAHPGDAFAVLPTPARYPRVLLYTSRLRVASADLDFARGAGVHGPIVLPFFARTTNYLFHDAIDTQEQLGRALPEFRLTPATRRLIEAWQQQPSVATLVIHATLQPGADERLLVVAHDVRLSVTARAGGVEVPPLDRALTNTRSVAHDSYRVGHAPGELALDVTFTRSAGAMPEGAMPDDVDLYEAPFPRCGP